MIKHIFGLMIVQSYEVGKELVCFYENGEKLLDPKCHNLV